MAIGEEIWTEEPKPGQIGSVKNRHRRSRSEDLNNVGETPGWTARKRKLYFDPNVDETPGSTARKRQLHLVPNVDQTPGWTPPNEWKLIFDPNVAAQEWTAFRLLISTTDVAAFNLYKHMNSFKKYYLRKENVEVNFHSVATGVGIVMVLVKRDSIRSVLLALFAFAVHHRYLLRSMPYDKCVTRLLVPAAHAKKLIILYTLKSHPHSLNMYLTGNMAAFFPGDVIVNVEGDREYVHKTVESVVSYLGEFGVDESTMLELKIGKGIRSSYQGMCVPEKTYSDVKAEGEFMARKCLRIPLSCIDDLIGKDGANIIKKIGESSPEVYVSLETFTLREVIIHIEGKCYSDVEVVVDVMEGLIRDQKKDAQFVFCKHDSRGSL
ncbi:unnamed protein product [Cuscuta campestris]|uniref:Uncharacterized protein n=1 Tax=Cuscuta campestris TaxID=132261 RepID=A0A484LWA5_9ASTE|nr:unnamed protein product [Cuscuta campestris]